MADRDERIVRGDDETPEMKEGPFARRTQLGYPPLGWTCFHCGETFRTRGGAQDHFGCSPNDDPACRIKIGEERGLVMELRKAEAEIHRLCSEERDYRQFVTANRQASAAARDVLAERRRQTEVEGHSTDGDDQVGWRTLARGSIAYAIGAVKHLIGQHSEAAQWWPFRDNWKPKDARRDMVRSVALGLAAIECIDRAAEKEGRADG